MFSLDVEEDPVVASPWVFSSVVEGSVVVPSSVAASLVVAVTWQTACEFWVE